MDKWYTEYGKTVFGKAVALLQKYTDCASYDKEQHEFEFDFSNGRPLDYYTDEEVQELYEQLQDQTWFVFKISKQLLQVYPTADHPQDKADWLATGIETVQYYFGKLRDDLLAECIARREIRERKELTKLSE